MIGFSDLQFIFRFVPVFLIIFYLAPVKYRTWIIVLGSYVFYAAADINYIWLLLLATLFNFFVGKAVFNNKKAYLVIGVVFDAALLIICKAFGLLVLNGLLPIGISFYTFKMISYQVDLYTGKISLKPTLKDTLAYFSMFPQITSGPIMRYSQFTENKMLDKHKFEGTSFKDNVGTYLDNIEEGLRYFIMGLAMKVIIADHLSMCFKEIGTIGYESISTPLAWFGAVVYSLNLYFDFWGYSLMAAGVGIAMGFPFIVNFDHPYSAVGVASFYRKWHVTLGTWFRDYIYIPLGGNRKGTLSTIFNLFVVWLITGLWHGVTFNFVLWGLSLFVIIVFEKYVLSKNSKVIQVVGRFNVLVLIPLTWVVFALSNVQDLTNYFGRLIPLFGSGINVNTSDIYKFIGNYGWYTLLGLVFLIPGIYDFVDKNRKHKAFTVVFFVLFWLCVYSISNAAGNPFMYLRF